MKRIALLIDDDELCRAPIADAMRDWGWEVFQARNGEEGIEMAVRIRPNLILCDLLMPRGNGFQVCRAVRSHIELKNTRIIVLSGRDYESDRKNAEEAGADAYLRKPIQIRKLQEILEQEAPVATPAAENSSPAPVSAGDDTTLVRFWGVRGSIPTPGPTTVRYGGNTSCIEVRADGELIILDAGTGLRPLGLSLVSEFAQRSISATVLITHTHWDHIQGLPFFIPAYKARNKIRILGYEGAKEGLAATLAGQMQSSYFPIAMKEMPGNISIEELKEMEFSLGRVRVRASFANHPGVCVGYRLETAAGSVVYLPDNEWSDEVTASGENVVPCQMESVLADFVRGADVLIMDTQYTAQEYPAHIGWGHGCAEDVVKLAMNVGVKQLYLFHHDPSHDDAKVDAMLAQARAQVEAAGSSLLVDAAREGGEIRLPQGAK